MTEGEATPAIHTASTEALEDARQFEYFCDAICTTYTGIRPERPEASGFPARYAAAQFRNLALASIQAPGHRARRDRAMLARQPDDSLFLNYSPWFGYKAEMADETVEVAAGRPLLLDNDQPFTVVFPTERMTLLTLRLPRRAVMNATPEGLATLNYGLSQSLGGKLVAQQMRILGEAFSSGDNASAAIMSQSVVSLMQHLMGQPAADRDLSMLRLMKRYAESRLSDPEFCLSELARQFACTPRTVQNHFAAQSESFSRWLLHTRLERARQMLENPANRTRSIAAIAYGCGFADATHFHRRFKARFGAPPGYFRP